MNHPRAGWLVALFAVFLQISVWLPWLTTSVHGGGHANAIGGSIGSLELPPRFGAGQLIVLLASALLVTGAMVGRNLSPRLASSAALVISMTVAGLAVWYYPLNVVAPVSVGYGFYLGAISVLGALGCSVWALLAAVRR